MSGDEKMIVWVVAIVVTGLVIIPILSITGLSIVDTLS